MTGKHFLGDGVYVRISGDTIVLTTENGFETTNTVFLEPGVWARLQRYVETAFPLPGEVPFVVGGEQ